MLKLDLFMDAHGLRADQFVNFLRTLARHAGLAHEINMVDIRDPEELERFPNVVATPMLVRTMPSGQQRAIVGELSDRAEVVRCLIPECSDAFAELELRSPILAFPKRKQQSVTAPSQSEAVG